MSTPETGPDNLPKISKPHQLISLEELTNEQLSAMTYVEKIERIQEVAYGLAGNYRREYDGNYDNCVLAVSTFLETTGAALGKSFGALMVAESNVAACEACREFFPESDPVEY